jgi:hypothetical protein
MNAVHEPSASKLKNVQMVRISFAFYGIQSCIAFFREVHNYMVS